MLKRVIHLALFLLFCTSLAQAAPPPPTVSCDVDDLEVTVSWTRVPEATGYTLLYAPYPYGGPETIQSLNMGNLASISTTLWDGAAFYVAVQAYDDQGSSGYSNIEAFFIDRGLDEPQTHYRDGQWSAATIEPNATVNGTLQSSDIAWSDGSYADFYILTLAGAETLTLSLESDAFDAYLFIYQESARYDPHLDTWFTPYWLGEDDDSSGGTDAGLSVTLSEGTYLIVANSFDAGESGAYTLTTSTTTLPAGGDPIELSSEAVDFRLAVGGAAPATQNVIVSYAGEGLLIGYPPGTEQPDWLTLERANEADTTSPVDVEISIDTAALQAGSHQATVRFLTGNLDGTDISYKDLTVTCVADAQISVDRSELEFSLVRGATNGAEQQSVAVSGDGVAWSASADQEWVQLSAASGTAPATLGIGIDPAGLTAGRHAATVTVATAGGGSETIAVRLTLEPHRLFVGDNGVAFSSFPTAASALTHTVTVADNIGVATPWTASSDQPWLEVTESGTTDGPLTLSADPTGLDVDTIHYATVTVNSNEPTIENVETVRVGLYVAGSDPSATRLSNDGANIVADPIRPYVYVTYTDYPASPSDGILDIYHIYTGEKVASLTAGSELKAMDVSSDGATLYVIDDADDTIVPVDLDTLNVGDKWFGSWFGVSHDNLTYTRFNGEGVVLTSQGDVFAAADGALVTAIPYYVHTGVVTAASRDGRSIYVTEAKTSGYGLLGRYRGNYSTVNDAFSVTETHALDRMTYSVRDIAASADGSRIYLAESGAGSFATYALDGSDLAAGDSLAAASYPTAVEVGPSGKIYGGASVYSGTVDAWSYRADHDAEATYSISGSLKARQLRVSGDGLRLLTLSEISSLSFLTFTEIAP